MKRNHFKKGKTLLPCTCVIILTDITVVKVEGTPSYSLTETSDLLPSENMKNSLKG